MKIEKYDFHNYNVDKSVCKDKENDVIKCFNINIIYY